MSKETFLTSLICFGLVGRILQRSSRCFLISIRCVLLWLFVCVLHVEPVCVCSHLSAAVRKCAAQHLADLLERVGVARLLSGGKDVTDRILPAVVKLALDSSPEPRHVEPPVASCVG